MRIISDNTASIFGAIIKYMTIFIVSVAIYILTFYEISIRIMPHIEFRHFQLKKFVYGAERQLGIASRCQSLGKEKYGFGGYVWERLTRNAEYGPRDGAAIAWHDEQLILVGCWQPRDKVRAPRKTMNDVWRSKDGRSWQLLKESSYGIRPALLSGEWTGRHKAGLVSFNGYLYLLGGDANQGYHQSDIWRSRDGRAWELVIERAPWAPRVLHMSFVFKDAIYVMGGQTMPKFSSLEQVSETYYNDAWRSKDGLNWEKIPMDGRTWSPRSGIGGNGFVFNGKIFLVGGFNYDGLVNSKRPTHVDIWSSADGSVWKLENANPEFSQNGEGFIFHDMAVFDNRLWIIGGARQWGDTAEIWSSKNGRDWTEHHCAPIPPSHASSVVGSEDGIIFAAGHHMTREVWKLTKADQVNK